MRHLTRGLRHRFRNLKPPPFIGTLQFLRLRLPECPASRRGLWRWYHNLVAEVAEAEWEDRRDRINPRVSSNG